MPVLANIPTPQARASQHVATPCNCARRALGFAKSCCARSSRSTPATCSIRCSRAKNCRLRCPRARYCARARSNRSRKSLSVVAASRCRGNRASTSRAADSENRATTATGAQAFRASCPSREYGSCNNAVAPMSSCRSSRCLAFLCSKQRVCSL